MCVVCIDTLYTKELRFPYAEEKDINWHRFYFISVHVTKEEIISPVFTDWTEDFQTTE